ncbi:LysR family transcriptional regulator [Photobacterium sp. TY1-4]|uniref:LysR family transcriptional regulator n=1 Tax=Photobacterium sp. TY1-4 TaxID=2899122 RepID=UPI0021C0A306|nr:LysR family transcriptional regulator [Photobacterium sp. TY1-4]UXI03144.1 LysR substrate-binding domain-containing protein [Photobacterium sp. TY1-4]
MNLESGYLRAFVSLAKSKSYTKSAHELHITQPALTKKIKTLEQTVGAALFIRHQTGTQLSQSGTYLFPLAEEIVRKLENLEERAAEIAQGMTGKIAIGFGISTYRLVPDLIKHYQAHRPQTKISLRDIASRQQFLLLESGELQVGFTRVPDNTQKLSYHPITTDQLVLIKPKHAARHNAENHLSELTLLQLTDEHCPGITRQVELFLQQTPCTLHKEYQDIQTIIALVSAGLGYSILPRSALHVADDRIDYAPLHGAFASWDICMTWNQAITDPVRDDFIQAALHRLQLPRLC